VRILYVTSHFPPRIGGVENHVANLARGAAAAGHHVDVLTHAHDGTPEREERDGYAVHRLRSRGFGPDLTLSPGLIAEVRDRRGRFDLLHAHNYHGSAALLSSVSWSGPLVLTPHFHGGGHSPLARIAHVPYRMAARTMFGRTDVAICVSRAERNRLVEAFPRLARRTVVIPNGVDVQQIREAQPIDQDVPVVLLLGRLDAYKRVDLAVRAFATLEMPARLVIVGIGAQLDRLRSLVRELSLETRVEFAGRVSTPDVHRWLVTAHVLVAMSMHEAFGLTLAEGLTGGASVVASDIPAHREVTTLVPDAPATLVPTSASAQDVGAAIAGRLALPRPGLTAGLPDWDDVAAQTIDVYRGLIAMS
jgi:glycosyltransferase involved in cell wall biosynthesis